MIIKTYEDGSEFTGTYLAATLAAALILSGVSAVAVLKYDAWKQQRLIRKLSN